MDAYLVYDADCRLCSLAKDLAKALDWRHRFRPLPMQDPRTATLLSALDPEERTATFHLVKDGEVSARGVGLIEVVALLPMGSGLPRLAAETPALRAASERVYDLLHSVRGRLQCAT